MRRLAALPSKGTEEQEMACFAYLRICLPPDPETWPEWLEAAVFASLPGLSGALFSSAKLLILHANVTAWPTAGPRGVYSAAFDNSGTVAAVCSFGVTWRALHL